MKELRQRVLDGIAERLAARGYRRSGRSFRREAGGGARLSLHVAFVNHVGDFDVVADVAVRHHAVEDLRNAERPLLKDAEKRQTATVGAELGNLAGTGQRRFNVQVDATAGATVEAAVDGVLAAFDDVGVPFLERFASLDEVRRVLLADGEEARLIVPVPAERPRVLAAIAAARDSS